MWEAIVQTLSEWKVRILALLPTLYGLMQVIEPDWVVDIVGERYKSLVMIALVGGTFLLGLIIPNPSEDKAA